MIDLAFEAFTDIWPFIGAVLAFVLIPTAVAGCVIAWESRPSLAARALLIPVGLGALAIAFLLALSLIHI